MADPKSRPPELPPELAVRKAKREQSKLRMQAFRARLKDPQHADKKQNAAERALKYSQRYQNINRVEIARKSRERTAAARAAAEHHNALRAISAEALVLMQIPPAAHTVAA